MHPGHHGGSAYGKAHPGSVPGWAYVLHPVQPCQLWLPCWARRDADRSAWRPSGHPLRTRPGGRDYRPAPARMRWCSNTGRPPRIGRGTLPGRWRTGRQGCGARCSCWECSARLGMSTGGFREPTVHGRPQDREPITAEAGRGINPWHATCLFPGRRLGNIRGGISGNVEEHGGALGDFRSPVDRVLLRRLVRKRGSCCISRYFLQCRIIPCCWLSPVAVLVRVRLRVRSSGSRVPWTVSSCGARGGVFLWCVVLVVAGTGGACAWW